MSQLLVQKYINHSHKACFTGKFINLMETTRVWDYFCNNHNCFSFQKGNGLLCECMTPLAFDEPEGYVCGCLYVNQYILIGKKLNLSFQE